MIILDRELQRLNRKLIAALGFLPYVSSKKLTADFLGDPPINYQEIQYWHKEGEFLDEKKFQPVANIDQAFKLAEEKVLDIGYSYELIGYPRRETHLCTIYAGDVHRHERPDCCASELGSTAAEAICKALLVMLENPINGHILPGVAEGAQHPGAQTKEEGKGQELHQGVQAKHSGSG